MDLARRNFLRGRLSSHHSPTRLPWLKAETEFFQHCTRCAECITACTEQIIIRGDGGYPEIDFKLGACTFCQQCAQICPEALFDNPQQRTPWKNIASISATCLTHSNIACQSCRDSCETDAISFRYQLKKVPHALVQKDLCTGCGACVSVCPNAAITIVSSENLQTGD